MVLRTVRDVFRYDLTVMFGAEQQVRQLVTELASEVVDGVAQAMLRKDARDTSQQLQKLERCFQILGIPRETATCEAIDGLRRDHDAFVRANPDANALTVFDLDLAEKIKEYEITAYRLLIAKACLLGLPECQRLLQENQRAEEVERHEAERSGFLFAEQMIQASVGQQAA